MDQLNIWSKIAIKLHFEPNLDFRLQTIESVCDLFRGQEICRTEFTVTRTPVESPVRLAFDITPPFQSASIP